MGKRLITLVISMLALAGTAKVKDVNLMINPGVENGKENWNYYCGAGRGGGEITDKEAHSGKKSYCLKFVKRIIYTPPLCFLAYLHRRQ